MWMVSPLTTKGELVDQRSYIITQVWRDRLGSIIFSFRWQQSKRSFRITCSAANWTRNVLDLFYSQLNLRSKGYPSELTSVTPVHLPPSWGSWDWWYVLVGWATSCTLDYQRYHYICFLVLIKWPPSTKRADQLMRIIMYQSTILLNTCNYVLYASFFFCILSFYVHSTVGDFPRFNELQ